MSKKFGALVKEARTSKGLTQEALAKKVKGLTASDISKIERGEKEPEKAMIKDLAAALDVTQTSLNAAMTKKTTAKKTGTGAKTGTKTSTKTGKKTSSGTTSKNAAELKLSAAEKKLVQAYRKADADTKKTALALLEGTASAVDLLTAYVSGKAGSSSGKESDSGSGLQDLLGSLMGGGSSNQSSSEKDGSLLGSLLENILGKK